MVPNTQTQANPNSMWSAFLDHSFLVCCSFRLALIPTHRIVSLQCPNGRKVSHSS